MCCCARHGPAQLCSAPVALMGLGDCQLGPPCHLLAVASRQPPLGCSMALPSDSWPWASLPRLRSLLGRGEGLAGALDISLHEGHVGSAHDVSLIPEEYLGAVWRAWGMLSLLEGRAAPGRGNQRT